METIEVLRQAADVIRQRGWTQYQNLDPETGAVCVDGAVHAVLFGDPQHLAGTECQPVLLELSQNLGEQQVVDPWDHDSPMVVTKWQDMKGRTQDEVLELIDTTIARLGG